MFYKSIQANKQEIDVLGLALKSARLMIMEIDSTMWGQWQQTHDYYAINTLSVGHLK